MHRQNAEKIITEYVKPIFGFALKNCKNVHDAEDLSQEIVVRSFRALLIKDDITNYNSFVWTIAHNALSNYYRDYAKSSIGISLDDVSETIGITHAFDNDNNLAAIRRLQSEIAYLSKLQRMIIIAYYFESKKQAEISKELGIPLGTIKWHLFEAKKDLKRGMNTMRTTSELKFNPIKFSLCGFSGSPGTKGQASNFFHSALAQNIAFCVSKEEKSIHEIADALGVSPVYIESETEYLEKYGFLIRTKDKYCINFLLDEYDKTTVLLMDEMYEKAAKIFANELFDVLSCNPILNDKNSICCNRMIGIDETNNLPIFEQDHNFMLWSFIPYITALSGLHLMDKSISFEEVYTIRPDGGKNIGFAALESKYTPKYFDSMKQFYGPCQNGFTEKFMLWTIDSEWSEKRIGENYAQTVSRDLSLFERFFNGDELSEFEYACMNEKGYLRKYQSEKGTWTTLQITWIRNKETKQKLLALGDHIKEKYNAEFENLKAPYVNHILSITPKHLQKVRKFWMQYIFYNDGWFILHCLKELVSCGKLKLPTDEQKRSLTALIAPND